MAVQRDELAASPACHVELSSGIVDAGGELKLKVSLVCNQPKEWVSRVVEIRDERNMTTAEAEFVTFDGNASETEWFAVKVPKEPGDYTWLAAVSFSGDTPSETATSVAFTVRAHTLNVVVWDVPSATVTGGAFRIHVGIKCSSNCCLEGHAFDVLDGEGALVATDRLGPQTWQNTEALHFSQIELRAPNARGRQEWKVDVPKSIDGLPHAAASATFGLVFVPPPECLLAVEAVDRDTREPITGAQIVAHPYRTFADSDGKAEMRVPKGEYTLFVSRRKYLPTKLAVAVTGDLQVTAELSLEPPPARE
jgi:hypothetical protein